MVGWGVGGSLECELIGAPLPSQFKERRPHQSGVSSTTTSPPFHSSRARKYELQCTRVQYRGGTFYGHGT